MSIIIGGQLLLKEGCPEEGLLHTGDLLVPAIAWVAILKIRQILGVLGIYGYKYSTPQLVISGGCESVLVPGLKDCDLARSLSKGLKRLLCPYNFGGLKWLDYNYVRKTRTGC